MFDKRLWQAAKQSRLWLILAVLFSGLGGLATILQAYLVSQTVNEVFLQNRSLNDVLLGLIWLFVVIGIRAGFSWGREIAANRIAIDVQLDLRARLVEHVLALGPLKAIHEQTGEITAVLTEGIDSLEKYFSEYLPQVFIAILVPLLILIVIFPLDWISGLILLFTAPLIPFFMVLIGRYAEQLTQKQWDLLSRMSAHFLDILQGLTTLKILGQSKAQAKNIEKITDRYRKVTMGVLQVAFLSALVLELLSMLSIAIIAVSIGLRLMVGGMAFSTALFILILAPEFYLPLRLLGQRFHAGMDGTSAAKRIFNLLDEPLPTTAINEPSTSTDKAFILPATIKFDQVGVTYQSREQAALNDLSLTFTPGKTLALVGASGAGKSTLASLLLRFIEPNEGRIFVNGESLASIETAVWREQITWVPQQPYLFRGSIAANIRLGKPNATDSELVAATKQAQLHEFIQTLPQGYDTPIGDRGAQLSGGQAQRIALARAFLKDTPFIILDEPTSQLDSETESALQDAIQTQFSDRMLLVIAHRLETVRQADEILVLENGRLVERGTHTELIKENGRYTNLISEQRVIANYQSEFTSIEKQPSSTNIEDRQNTANKKPISSRKTIQRLSHFIFLYKKWIALSVLLGTIAIGSGVALLATSAYLISRAAQLPEISALSVAIVGVRFFGLARGVFRYLERLVSHNVTFKILARLRVWFFEALEPLAPARLQQYGSGDLLSRIVSDVDTLENFYIRAINPPLVALMVGAVFIIFMAVFQPLLAIIVLVFLLIAGMGLPIFIRQMSKKSGQARVRIGGELKMALVDTIQGLADLEAFNAAESRLQQINQKSSSLAFHQKKMARITGMQSSFMELFTFVAMWCVLLAAIPLIHQNQMDGVYLATAVLATVAIFEAVQPLPAAAQYLDQSLAAARRLFAIVDIEPEVKPPTQPIPLPESCDIQLEEVGFRYETAVLSTLSQVNLNLHQGKKIGIIGQSGSGKSTLINLLLRFWDWDEGKIMLNGHSLRDYDPNAVRECFSIVSQKAYLFNTTIYENLRLANPLANQERIHTAARMAKVHEFITNLPDGYQTQVGSLGRQLSGGEQRRLAIAQAILKNAPILILDEATANLDLTTEKQVMETMLSLAKERSLLLVTHRPVGLDQMDEVWRIENGRFHKLVR